MNKKILALGFLLILLGLGNAFVVKELPLETKKPVELTIINLSGETRKLAKNMVNNVIATSEDGKGKYYVSNVQPIETKVTAQVDENTNTVIVTIQYLNGQKATFVTTKNKIQLKETGKP